MRVVVVGAGIGGLACAQGLVQRGLDVQVAERDAGLAMTGGYKLHLGVPAALRGRRLPQARGSSPGLEG
ncbi:MAG: FAD-dependent oxidoreductase [Arthrobacter sp.]|nr:NAD(P)-binding protein [Arthrobacter sp.]MDO5753951.1 FAD-dependent oxidoreductase [Arthrobacter sp.]